MIGRFASWAGLVFMPVAEDVPASGGETSAIPAVVAEVARMIRAGSASVGLVAEDLPEGLDTTKRSPIGNYADKTRKRVARLLYPALDAEDAAQHVSTAIRNTGTKKAPQYRAWIVLNEAGQANPPQPLADTDEDDTDA